MFFFFGGGGEGRPGIQKGLDDVGGGERQNDKPWKDTAGILIILYGLWFRDKFNCVY